MLGHHSRKLDDAAIDKVVDGYCRQALSHRALSAQYNVSTAVIRNALKMRGVPSRAPGGSFRKKAPRVLSVNPYTGAMRMSDGSVVFKEAA